MNEKTIKILTRERANLLTGENITIPHGYTVIGEGAFVDRNDIKRIEIPDSILIIDDDAFLRCENLKEIIIPESVVKIGSYVFVGCKSLESTTIPPSVKSIGELTFSSCIGCESLENINVDPNNQAYSSVEGVLFNKDKTVLIKYPDNKPQKSYTIPNSVKIIEAEAFKGSLNLTSVLIPGSVAFIGDSAFFYCLRLTEVTIPSSVVKISGSTFGGCERLEKICVDKNNLMYCDEDGILFNKKKTAMLVYPANKTDPVYAIPCGVVTVDSGAFSDCKHLESVIMPESMTFISKFAFNNCNKLKKPKLSDNTAFVSGVREGQVFI